MWSDKKMNQMGFGRSKGESTKMECTIPVLTKSHVMVHFPPSLTETADGSFLQAIE
jgi:hypothetical protein